MSGREDVEGSRPAPRARPAAVAGTFYPGGAGMLADLVDDLLAEAARVHPTPTGAAAHPLGILVPHAGLVYSGLVAATAWRLLGEAGSAGTGSDATPRVVTGPDPAPVGEAARSATVVMLGTNHGAAWLDGVGAWDGGPWWTPLGEVGPDAELARAIVDLGPPFAADARCHLGEHSLEVQLPLLRRVAPHARIAPLSVGAGTGRRAIEAGERLGTLLAARRMAGAPIVLAISSDMAHYPAAVVAERVTSMLVPHIVGLAPEALAAAETEATWVEPGVSCGMCGIEPTVLGLAALRTMGARPGTVLAAATSADAGGDPHRTVGYLAVAFPAA